MGVSDHSLRRQAQRYEDIASKSLDQGMALAIPATRGDFSARRAARQAGENLVEDFEALFDLADANPDPRVDIALREQWNLESQFVVGRIGEGAPRVEVAPRCAADIAAAAVFDGERGAQHPRAHRTVLQRGGVVVERDEPR